MFVGTWHQAAGASGTVTLTAGAVLAQIVVHATGAGTVVIFGGPSIPVPAGTGFALRFNSGGAQAVGAANTVVFTGTDSYFVESIGPGNT